MSFFPEPKLTTLVVTAEETRRLNEIVQIYAKSMLFYRNDAPDLIDAFRQGRHLVFCDSDNTLQRLIHMVPGVPPPHPQLESLRRFFRDRDAAS